MPNRAQGRVQVQIDKKGYLTFQLPMVHALKYYGKKQKYISFGAKDTQENRALAMTAAVRMQQDMEANKFDPDDVISYKHPSKQIKGRYQQKTECSFNVLELYQDFKKHLNVCITTLKGTYGTYHNHLKKMEDTCKYTLKQQLEIRSWIQSNVAQSMALKTLKLLHRMIEWGKREERLPDTFVSKFNDYGTEFKKSLKTVNTKRKPPKYIENLPRREGIQAWSEEERDIIISAFYNRKKYDSKIDNTDYVAPLVDFAFNTGCRHGEAFKLTWGDINNDFTHVSITESYSSTSKIVKCTKTGKTRLTPLNLRMQGMLKKFKPINASPSDLIFKTKKGGHLSTDALFRWWIDKKDFSVIGSLIKEGKLPCYIEFYSTRRTFISLQISKGASVVDVANWVGDNPETILKYYARHNDKSVPH